MLASFRNYSSADRDVCLAIFDANCPSFFAPNEREDYVSYLDAGPEGYEVCELDGRLVAAFGLVPVDGRGCSLNWIMLHPDSQGAGIGSAIMQRVIALGRKSGFGVMEIAASHKSAPFFARFGGIAIEHTADGWGPGMDRVDMVLEL